MNRAIFENVDLLYVRLDQVNAILHTLRAENHHSILNPDLVTSTLLAAGDLLAQAKQAADNLWNSVRKEAATARKNEGIQKT